MEALKSCYSPVSFCNWNFFFFLGCRMGIDRSRLKRELEIKMKEGSGVGEGGGGLYPQCGLSVRKNFCQ